MRGSNGGRSRMKKLALVMARGLLAVPGCRLAVMRRVVRRLIRSHERRLSRRGVRGVRIGVHTAVRSGTRGARRVRWIMVRRLVRHLR